MELNGAIKQGLTRRAVMAALGAGWATAAFAASPKKPPIAAEVWKDESCGCCKDWVAHLEANGFKVKVHDGGNDAARAKLGVPAQYGSCHTALIGGYAIEGHVPAREIRRLLKEEAASHRPVGARHAGGLAGHGCCRATRAAGTHSMSCCVQGRGCHGYQQYPEKQGS